MELCLACFTRLYNLFKPPVMVAPEGDKICIMCFELGASKRKCCNAIYCDHCYTKDKFCPNCNISTRREEKSGATFTLNTFSEHEECRVCLEPGLQRNCCGNYYCDDCYYQLPRCRSCHNKVSARGVGFSIRAESFPVLLGWLTSIGVVILFAAFFIVLTVSEASQPHGISNYFCDGFFRKCSISVCVDLPQSVANGSTSIPAIHTWQHCSLESTVKLISKGCVFDSTLYASTVTNMGYDVCKSEFEPGVYIFEDTFEYWNNSDHTTKMKSALWATVINGRASPACGVANYLGGKDALVFTGPMQRFAETKDLDVRSGGYLEAQLFIAPDGWDVAHPLCKSNYEGTINVDYSIDGGHTWVTMETFLPLVWRQVKFFAVKFDVPPEAMTETTRFRFIQPLFEAARDQWALDNVRVFRNLPHDWETSTRRQTLIKEGVVGMQQAQCCFDTDWCEKRLTKEERQQCHNYPWYKEKTYLLRNAELVLCLAMAIGLIKFFYVSAQDYLIWERYPFQDDLNPLITIMITQINKLLPARYRRKRDISKYIENVHVLARMHDMHEHLHEEEGEGDRIKRSEEKQAEREQRRMARARKRAKKLEKRNQLASMKTKHAAAQVAELDEQPDSSDSEESQEEAKNMEQFAVTDGVADDIEKLKRQNLSVLKYPFEIRRSEFWIHSFALVTIGFTTVLFLYQISSTKYYFVYQIVQPFGTMSRSIFFNSYLFNVFALFVDLKEIWYCIRYVIPLRKVWDPLVTLDRSSEVMSLFIDHHSIPLENIESIQLFSHGFCMLCGWGYFLAAMPWAVMSMVLRSQYLDYAAMRVVTPIIGGVLFARAILGPAVFIKICFAGYYLLSYNMFTRERIGLACMQPKTINSAINVAIAFAVMAGILTGIVAYSWFLQMIALAFVFGLIYGALAGWQHGMPIKPWIHLTTLDGGMYLVLKKKQQCPFVYWGNYCSEMHQFTEVLMFFTADDVQFINSLKGGADVVL